MVGRSRHRSWTAIHLRRATGVDASPIASLVDAAYAPWVERLGMVPGPMTVDHDALVRDQEVVVAERDAIVGVLVLATTDDRLVLENVAVHPDHQGAGIGQALLEHAEQLARVRGHASVDLYAHERMTENLALYERVGYVETDRRSLGDFSLVYMRKLVARRS